MSSSDYGRFHRAIKRPPFPSQGETTRVLVTVEGQSEQNFQIHHHLLTQLSTRWAQSLERASELSFSGSCDHLLFPQFSVWAYGRSLDEVLSNNPQPARFAAVLYAFAGHHQVPALLNECLCYLRGAMLSSAAFLPPTEVNIIYKHVGPNAPVRGFLVECFVQMWMEKGSSFVDEIALDEYHNDFCAAVLRRYWTNQKSVTASTVENGGLQWLGDVRNLEQFLEMYPEGLLLQGKRPDGVK